MSIRSARHAQRNNMQVEILFFFLENDINYFTFEKRSRK